MMGLKGAHIRRCLPVQGRLPALPFLLAALLALAGCGVSPRPVSTTPADAAPRLEANVALGFALQYLETTYGETFGTDAEAGGAAPVWQRSFDPPPEVMGAVALRFETASCVATVAYPVLTETDPLFYVTVDDSATGFHWCGEVANDGRVTELVGPSQPDVAEVAASALFARQAVVGYLRDHDQERAPAATLSWTARQRPEGYRFSADGWEVVLNRPVIPGSTDLYTVAVTCADTGFTWTGTVDCFCHVRE